MPHVDIKCFAGRTEEQKRECANQIAEVIANTLGCEMSDGKLWEAQTAHRFRQFCPLRLCGVA